MVSTLKRLDATQFVAGDNLDKLQTVTVHFVSIV